MRTKKIALNMICDIVPYLLIGIVGLIKVNYLITYLGDANNGYYQFINQIISYVFLAQAGFCEAVIYSLYKPFAEKNKDDINKIYSGARYIFKKIGLIIFGLIILVSIGLYLYYHNEQESLVITLSFFIIASSYLISYFGKTQTYTAVLSANQERYIYSNVLNIIKLICDILTIFVIVWFRSLVAIAILILIVKIIEEIVMRFVVKKKYSYLKEVSDKNTTMIKMTKDLVWMQVGTLVLNNVDAVLIMHFLGPIWVSIYTSYNFILRYLNEIASRLNYATVYSFGNVFAKKESDRAYPLFKELQSLFMIIAIAMSLTFLLGIRTFILFWIKDANYILSYTTATLFTLTTFFYILYLPLLSIINSNGLFKENKYHILTCALINVILSLILVNFFQINGLLIATITSFIVNIILKCNLINKKIFNNINYFKLISPYIIITISFIFIIIISKPLEIYLLKNITSILNIVITLFSIFIILFIILFIIMYLVDSNTRNLYQRITNLIKKRK